MPVSELTMLKIENLSLQIQILQGQRQTLIRDAQLEAGVSERATWNVQTRQFTDPDHDMPTSRLATTGNE